MKCVAIIQARMGSSRLRGKSLLPVAGVPLLTRVIHMVKATGLAQEIVVATTELEEDGPIVSLAQNAGVGIARGSSLNVLERFVQASAHLNENDIVIRFTADNLFCNVSVAKQALDAHQNQKSDYTHIEGLSKVVPEFFTVRALREAAASGRTDAFDQEHIGSYLRRHKNQFHVLALDADTGGLRFDLDKLCSIEVSEDIDRVENLLHSLKLENGAVSDFSSIHQWLQTADRKIAVASSNTHDIVVDFCGTPVGSKFPAYIIAEIGQNHNGDVRIAKKLIDMAVRCGANAVKFQKRDIPSELTKEAFDKPYDNPNSFGRTYGEHRMFLELDEAQHLELKEYANAAGITYFCTPCDVPSVELLERIGCPFYKVASRDLTNIPLLEKLGTLNKPVIISTGMADFNDINDAIAALKKGPDSLVIMQCTSEYPCKLENVNLRAMETLRQEYGHLVGLSDHTSGVIISAAAAVMGAVMIEKHVTLDRTMKGTDQPGSLEEDGLKKLVEYIRASEIAMGDGVKEVNPATKAAKEKLARSVTSKVNIAKGTVLTDEMLTLKSPGTGLKWNQRHLITGKKALHDIEADVTLSSTDFE
jgi:sialic acid synthase SpsE/spore coat polysaccharide biosynthesis protein SpsF (cytidylyltransferase family)